MTLIIDIVMFAIGFIVMSLSVIILLRTNRRNSIASFRFTNGSHEFIIEKPGYYSISIIGASDVYKNGNYKLDLLTEKGKLIRIKRCIPTYKFRLDGEVGIEYWGFFAADVGKHVLSFDDIHYLEARNSLLLSKRLNDRQVELEKLKILVYRSSPPLVKLIAIISLVSSLFFLMYGVSIFKLLLV